MKLNIASPGNGTQKLFEIEDSNKLLPFYERRMGHEVLGDSLGDEFKGYVFRITGGNDKQGFPMMQGVLLNRRARLLLREGMKCFRARRKGYRKRKSVRGCIVGPDLSVLALTIVKKGEEDIPGLTDTTRPRRLGPKRATRIRKLFGLTKGDNVQKFVVRRKLANGHFKAPKIQRLLTNRKKHRQMRLRRDHNERRLNSHKARQEFAVVMEEWKKERAEKVQHKISSAKKSTA